MVARVAVPFGDAEIAPADFQPRSFIDEQVLAELRRLRLPPSPRSDDAEFFRRVHLDLIGRLPEPAEVLAFLHEPASDEKRRRVIAALIAREEFVDFWTLKFGEWLLMSGKHERPPLARRHHRGFADLSTHRAHDRGQPPR